MEKKQGEEAYLVKAKKLKEGVKGVISWPREVSEGTRIGEVVG